MFKKLHIIGDRVVPIGAFWALIVQSILTKTFLRIGNPIFWAILTLYLLWSFRVDFRDNFVLALAVFSFLSFHSFVKSSCNLRASWPGESARLWGWWWWWWWFWEDKNNDEDGNNDDWVAIFYTDHFCPTKFTPKKKFLAFKVLNGHKKHILFFWRLFWRKMPL